MEGGHSRWHFSFGSCHAREKRCHRCVWTESSNESRSREDRSARRIGPDVVIRIAILLRRLALVSSEEVVRRSPTKEPMTLGRLWRCLSIGLPQSYRSFLGQVAHSGVVKDHDTAVASDDATQNVLNAYREVAELHGCGQSTVRGRHVCLGGLNCDSKADVTPSG